MVIFVSYSHKDEREKDKLLSHLGVLQQEGLIGLWSDDRIGAGADWRQEINQAMAQARVAILLISANFLTSDFILREEVPELLKRREREGLTVFPVIIKECAWQEVGWLTKMNVRPKNGRAIWGAGARRVDADLAAIAKEVASVVKEDGPVTPTATGVYGKSERVKMEDQPKTGSVTSKSGKVIIGGKAVVGVELQGPVSDETLQAALKALQQLQTGGISGDKGVEIKGDFIGGLSFHYFDPAQPTPETFLAELKLLRQQVAELAAGPEALTEAEAAVTSLDETIAEVEKEKPLARRLISRLKEAVGFITDTGKALEAAGKAGPLITQALGTATVLYQAAQRLF